jgi:hypothetical protein
MFSGLKGFFPTVDQVRAEAPSGRLSDRAIEAWLPERNLRVRITIDRVEVQSGLSGAMVSRAASLLAFEGLIKAFAAELNVQLGGGVLTHWTAHVRQAGQDVAAEKPGPHPSMVPKYVPGMGQLLNMGNIFHFGASPWDPSAAATTLIIEPSNLISGGYFLSMRNLWSPASAEPLVQRYSKHFSSSMKVLDLPDDSIA